VRKRLATPALQRAEVVEMRCPLSVALQTLGELRRVGVGVEQLVYEDLELCGVVTRCAPAADKTEGAAEQRLAPGDRRLKASAAPGVGPHSLPAGTVVIAGSRPRSS
jgi:hypothetical protein